MKLQVVAKSGILFEGEVTDAVVPAADGELGILPGHTPLLAILQPGSVRFTLSSGQEQEILTSRGFVTVDSDEIMVVVESQRSSDR